MNDKEPTVSAELISKARWRKTSEFLSKMTKKRQERKKEESPVLSWDCQGGDHIAIYHSLKQRFLQPICFAWRSMNHEPCDSVLLLFCSSKTWDILSKITVIGTKMFTLLCDQDMLMKQHLELSSSQDIIMKKVRRRSRRKHLERNPKEKKCLCNKKHSQTLTSKCCSQSRKREKN